MFSLSEVQMNSLLGYRNNLQMQSKKYEPEIFVSRGAREMCQETGDRHRGLGF